MRADREKGAVAIVVALVMTLLLLCLGIAIDLGASYWKRQELQNGADAAALALAQGVAPGACVPDSVTATSWVQGNVRNDVIATGTATCLAVNKVSVRAATVQQHWFLPIMGRGSSDIAADATVMWGVPIAGEASLPIAISECSFLHRVDGVDVPIDGNITIWMDHPSDPFGDACHEAYPDGGFGWLKTVGGKCAARIDIAADGTGGVGYSKTGTPQPDECQPDNSFKRAVLSGEPVLIPIFDVAPGGGNGAPISISRFAAFILRGYDIHNKLGAYPASGICGTKPSSELKSCLYGEFVEYLSFEAGMELVAPKPGDQTYVIKMTD
ncbi:pilus assembly protein TadG-related protein [Ornithinimicrobium humiphilum]|uniref:pilus assembly protein TadG-related protein n=1 Tax=Ornithinimicrobium humiphilum TaxID=125288 RepID=UPI001478557E|nr:pilus assembly protein TadG-related protein [Ornithinimicrobium humiphilum]